MIFDYLPPSFVFCGFLQFWGEVVSNSYVIKIYNLLFVCLLDIFCIFFATYYLPLFFADFCNLGGRW